MKPLNLEGRLGDFLAVIAGASLPLAFAPYSLFPIAVLSPALLFLLWQDISTKRAFWRGWLYGVSLFSIGTSWVHISFYQFGGVSLIGAIFLTTLFVLVLAIYPALLGAALTRYFPKNTSSTLSRCFCLVLESKALALDRAKAKALDSKYPSRLN